MSLSPLDSDKEKYPDLPEGKIRWPYRIISWIGGISFFTSITILLLYPMELLPFTPSDIFMFWTFIIVFISGFFWVFGFTKGKDRRPHLGEMMGGGRR